MVCNVCQFENCSKHKCPWHKGKYCAEYDEEVERLDEARKRMEKGKGRAVQNADED
jgi:hypothetical protein